MDRDVFHQEVCVNLKLPPTPQNARVVFSRISVGLGLGSLSILLIRLYSSWADVRELRLFSGCFKFLPVDDLESFKNLEVVENLFLTLQFRVVMEVTTEGHG